MIIGYEDIRAIRPIAENMVDEKRMLPYMKEADNLYLKKYITPILYKDISENRNDYDLLFNGGYYDLDTKYFIGLKEAMGYLSYSRFVRNQNVNVTAFGIVSKQGNYSETVDEKTIMRTSNDAEKIGHEYLIQCVDYLKFIGKIETCEKTRTYRKFKSIGD